MKVTVLSTFDVWPAKDGGQTRFVNFWTSLSPEIEVVILAYDFRNRLFDREYRLSPSVSVKVPTADPADVALFGSFQAMTSLWLHDVLCMARYRFSRGFLDSLADCLATSDVVVASHPYLAMTAFPLARPGSLLIYESHNVEFDIKKDYFGKGLDATLLDELLEQVRYFEGSAARWAHHVTAVSEADKSRLIDLYSVPAERISIAPNGARVVGRARPDGPDRARFREALDLSGRLAGVFLGSSFEANVESYRRGRLLLDQAGFKGVMFLVGSIAAADRSAWPEVDFEERWFGFVSDELRDALVSSADFAFHMIFAGAGTNLKLFDYMSLRVPIVANGFGRRGVPADGWALGAETVGDLRAVLARIAEDEAGIAEVAEIAYGIARDEFDWKSIGARFEANLRSRFALAPGGSLEGRTIGGRPIVDLGAGPVAAGPPTAP